MHLKWNLSYLASKLVCSCIIKFMPYYVFRAVSPECASCMQMSVPWLALPLVLPTLTFLSEFNLLAFSFCFYFLTAEKFMDDYFDGLCFRFNDFSKLSSVWVKVSGRMNLPCEGAILKIWELLKYIVGLGLSIINEVFITVINRSI